MMQTFAQRKIALYALAMTLSLTAPIPVTVKAEWDIQQFEVFAGAPYVRDDGVLIVLASWSDEDQVVDVTADLESLGIDPSARVWTPAVEGLQRAGELDLDAVLVPAGQGLFIRLGG